MEINLSEEMVEVIYASLSESMNNKLREYQKERNKEKKVIIDKRITEVEEAADIFRELMNEITFRRLREYAQ